ncbi:hypothetical protein BHM03_00052303 [Ensete ventricosum]|nr:hypothetical protein BHM03_00052303 [Ensete ventricosum]
MARKVLPRLLIFYRNEGWLIGLGYGPREAKVEMGVAAIDAAGLTVMADLMVGMVEEVVMSSLNALQLFGTSAICSITWYDRSPSNAQRGGNGTSKSKVGSRGSDKVNF